jgi:hypothetical protein
MPRTKEPQSLLINLEEFERKKELEALGWWLNDLRIPRSVGPHV